MTANSSTNNSSDVRTSPRFTLRTRDATAILSVLGIGAALVYCLLVRGGALATQLVIASFISAGLILLLGYGGGAVVDRLGRRYPALVKKRYSSVTFFIIAPALALCLYMVWSTRTGLVGTMNESANDAIVSVQKTLSGMFRD